MVVSNGDGGLHERDMWWADTAQKEEREVERLREQERVRAGRELLQASLLTPAQSSQAHTAGLYTHEMISCGDAGCPHFPCLGLCAHSRW